MPKRLSVWLLLAVVMLAGVAYGLAGGIAAFFTALLGLSAVAALGFMRASERVSHERREDS